MKFNMPNDLKNRVPSTPIFYKTDQAIRKTTAEKADSLKVDIKAQPGKSDSDMVEIYVPLFRTGSLEAWKPSSSLLRL